MWAVVPIGRVILPQWTGHSPLSTRTRDDFPDADAPVTIRGVSLVTFTLKFPATVCPRGVTMSTLSPEMQAHLRVY